MIIPVILSGGSGTRLWPVSTPQMPKQLLSLTHPEFTMLQLTSRRVVDESRFSNPIIVANEAHAESISAQLSAINISEPKIILEPVARNTAPAIALAALSCEQGDGVLLVMPSDHVIADQAAFDAAIAKALPLVEDGWLCTFGIEPTAPETGYGYIKSGEQLMGGAYAVQNFVEKPHADKAQQMLGEGGYSWNAGIFMFRARDYLAALQKFAPAILDTSRSAMNQCSSTGALIYPDASCFATSPSDSVDYAVMEKAEKVAVIPVSMGWSDVGSWDALHGISDKDQNDNLLAGDIIAQDSSGCLIRSDGPRISVCGLEDFVVIAEGDDIVIFPRSHSQQVKSLAEARKK